jgi:hypothetical protein
MKRLLIALMLVGMPILALAQHEKPTKNVFDADIVAGQTVNWDKDTIYILQEIVYAESGAVVNIQAGTQVKGIDGPAGSCGALVICRGARIFAIGTPYEPIIFTAEIDSVPDPTDIPLRIPGGGENLNRGLWGGLMILGRACTNSFSPDTAFSEGQIEGVPLSETRARYGGGAACNDDDTSGVLKYVSIRHGGNIFALDNEINGLTMGGVGRGTIIENIEVFQNFDDGFEWFGGAVNTRCLISAFNTDDMFDTDEGWRGKNQFWFAIVDSQLSVGNSGTERDGGTVPEDSIPLATHTQWNSTYIGSGKFSANVNNNPAFNLRDNNASSEFNTIITDFRRRGMTIEDLGSGEDSRQQLDSGNIVFEHNIWWGFGDDTTLAGDDETQVWNQAFVRAVLWDPGPNATDNRIVDPLLLGISRDPDGGLDPRPAPGSPAYVSPGVPADTFFKTTGYIGAFGPDPCSTCFLGTWTALYQYGYLDTALTNSWTSKPGDANASGTYSLSDVISIVNYIFNKPGCSPQPTCWLSGRLCRGDWNGSGTVSLSDVIQAVNFIFNKPNGPWNAVPICPCLNQA